MPPIPAHNHHKQHATGRARLTSTDAPPAAIAAAVGAWTVKKRLCTCLILIAVPTFACFPPKQAAAPADNRASNLGPFNVDGISFKVEMNLPGNYVLLNKDNKMMTYSGPGVSTFAACGQLSPDGRSLGMVSKQGTIAKVGKLTVWVAGIIFKSLGYEAYAMVKVFPNGAFAQYSRRFQATSKNHQEEAYERFLRKCPAVFRRRRR